MFKRILILVALATPAIAQNTQTGDLNTNTQDSVVDSNNPSTTNNYNGAGAASDVTPPPTAVAPSVPSGGSDSCLISGV
jgi:hypothetical protein